MLQLTLHQILVDSMSGRTHHKTAPATHLLRTVGCTAGGSHTFDSTVPTDHIPSAQRQKLFVNKNKTEAN